MTSTVEQGDIVLVRFPFSDLTQFKIRPALVISNDSFHGHDVILCSITSRSSQLNEVSISNKDLQKGQLPLTSYLRVGKLFTFEKSLIKKVVAKISPEKMREIAMELAKILKPPGI